MADRGFPILTVGDIEAVAAFYERLGFRRTYAFPEDAPQFIALEREGSTIGLGAGGGERFSYWVYVDDVDEAFAALVDGGAQVVGPPKDEPWGERVAHVRDPDGNQVHLGAPIDPA
jgi:lactoylglutathione lyase